MPGIDRRRFLAGAGALGVLPAPRAAPAHRAAADERFAWGVASFDPTPDAVLLWTRVRPAPAPVRLRWSVARDPDLSEVVASGQITVGEATDHCASVDATDLGADQTWWYAFETADGGRSTVGRTRTLPRSPDRLRLGVVSCARYATAPFAAYRALADREVDVVVHLGDYIYEDGGGGDRQHEPAHALHTVQDYRARYAQHRTDPDLQELHARHPVVAVWDDHEVAGNAWRDGAPGHDPARDGPWTDRLRAASDAHEDWLPGRTTRADDGRLRAWRSLSLGSLADLVVLDTRTWGRDRQPTTGAEVGGPPQDGSANVERSMLGSDQAAFVAERLQRPDDPAQRPPWVLLANQVMFHPLRVPVPSAALVDEITMAGLLVVGDEALNADQWDGYPQARDALERRDRRPRRGRRAHGRSPLLVGLGGPRQRRWRAHHGRARRPERVLGPVLGPAARASQPGRDRAAGALRGPRARRAQQPRLPARRPR